MKKYLMFFCITSILIISSIKLKAQWKQVNVGSAGKVNCISVIGSDVFAGSISGIFRSTDYGESWRSVGGGYTNCITSYENNIFAGTISGLFVSKDGGNSWTSVTNLSYYITALAVSGNNIFVGTYQNGIFRSTDNGNSWTTVNNGLGDFQNLILALAVDSNGVSGTTIYAGTAAGLCFSSDNGNSWSTEVADNLSSQQFINCITVNDSNIFIGTPNGVLKSIKGRSIEKADSGLDSMTSIYSIATNNLYTYLATTSGVYMSTDNGSSWTAINNGLPASISQVYSVAASPSISGGTNLYAGTYYGVYMSTNNGVNWTASNNGIVGGLQIENLTGSGSYIFAEFSIPPDYNTYSNYISSDYGKTWQDADSSFPTGGRLTMIGTNLYVSNSQGIFISYDYGKTWNSLNENEMDTLYPGYPGILVKSGSNLIVTTKNGLYLSSDKGTSWKPTGTNLPPNLYSIVTIGPDVFAGFVEAGVYISTDNGETWSVDNDTLYTLGEFVSIGSTIFADRGPWFGGDNIPPYKGGVFRSTDFGKTWSYASSGLPANPYPSQLVVHGTDIFVCISQDNFYMSGDNGNSWHKMGSGSENFVYSASLILFVNDSSIFVGANQSGIWQFPLSEITAVKYPLNSAVPAFSVLEQNYPNPFNPSTTIKYQLPMTNFVTLKVYDILGREVETLVNERQSAGTHSVTFNAGGLSSGVYFYRIIAGSFVQTKKLMVIK